VRPVAEMMPLDEAAAAAGEATASVPMVERSPQGGGNGPGAGDAATARLLTLIREFEVRGQLSDLVTEPVQIRSATSSERMHRHGEPSFS